MSFIRAAFRQGSFRRPTNTDKLSEALAQALAKKFKASLGEPEAPAVSDFSRSIGITPDPWQAFVLDSPSKRILLNCSRQSGKSQTMGVRGAHHAIYTPDLGDVLAISRAQRQSRELFDKVKNAIEAAQERDLTDRITLVDTRLELKLDNGCRVMAMPGNEATVRGISALGLLLIDEASRVPDTLFRSITPMVAVSDGAIIAGSTPFGKRGWWFEEWIEGKAWEKIEVPATACPRISPEFLAEEKARHGEDWWFQEYMCTFLDQSSTLFSYDAIQEALKAGDYIPPLDLFAGMLPTN